MNVEISLLIEEFRISGNEHDLYDRVETVKDNAINGPMHTEIMLSNNTDVHIIETHLRFGGDNIPELIQISSNFDPFSFWCKQILDKSVSFDSVPEITSTDANFYVAIIYIIPQPTLDSFSKLGYLIIKTKSYEKISTLSKTIHEKIRINTK